MFNSKQTQLFGVSPKTNQKTSDSTMSIPDNPFLRAGIKKSVTTNRLGNGATKLTTTGSDFVDDLVK